MIEIQHSGGRDLPANKIETALWDIALVLGTLISVKLALLQIDALWTYAGPVATLASVGVASWRLRRNNEGWGDLGLNKPRSIRKMLMWSLIIMVVTIALGIFVEMGLASVTAGNPAEIDPRYSDRFANIEGNTAEYLYWVAVAWIIGGFAEEMLFRGMLFSRFERLFSRLPFSLFAAVVMQAVIFGQQHYYYQGLNGAFSTGAIALISGVFYIFLKRNLWALTLSHGLANTLGLTLIYTGIQPAA